MWLRSCESRGLHLPRLQHEAAVVRQSFICAASCPSCQDSISTTFVFMMPVYDLLQIHRFIYGIGASSRFRALLCLALPVSVKFLVPGCIHFRSIHELFGRPRRLVDLLSYIRRIQGVNSRFIPRSFMLESPSTLAGCALQPSNRGSGQIGLAMGILWNELKRFHGSIRWKTLKHALIISVAVGTRQVVIHQFILINSE